MSWSAAFGSVIGHLISWVKERKEQKAAKTAHEKDRPRFRVDITKVPTAHAAVPAFVMKILSLGRLPVTINDGEVFVTAEHYPERVDAKKLGGREIGPSAPIKLEFPF